MRRTFPHLEQVFRHALFSPEMQQLPFILDGLLIVRSSSLLAGLLPEYARLDLAVRVIDVAQVFPGCERNVAMDSGTDRALGRVREAPAGKSRA